MYFCWIIFREAYQIVAKKNIFLKLKRSVSYFDVTCTCTTVRCQFWIIFNELRLTNSELVSTATNKSINKFAKCPWLIIMLVNSKPVTSVKWLLSTSVRKNVGRRWEWLIMGFVLKFNWTYASLKHLITYIYSWIV